MYINELNYIVLLTALLQKSVCILHARHAYKFLKAVLKTTYSI